MVSNFRPFHPWPRSSQEPRQKRPEAPTTYDIERREFIFPLGFIKGINLAGEFWQTTKTDNYSAGNEMVILVDASSSKVTITLPIASTNVHKVYYIKKVDTSNNKVIVKGYQESEEIDGEKEFDITVPYTCITPICDGTNWWII